MNESVLNVLLFTTFLHQTQISHALGYKATGNYQSYRILHEAAHRRVGSPKVWLFLGAWGVMESDTLEVMGNNMAACRLGRTTSLPLVSVVLFGMFNMFIY